MNSNRISVYALHVHRSADRQGEFQERHSKQGSWRVQLVSWAEQVSPYLSNATTKCTRGNVRMIACLCLYVPYRKLKVFVCVGARERETMREQEHGGKACIV